ncbi:MAG: ABC transporter ATP-binding protein [Sedimentitalea sp.]
MLDVKNLTVSYGAVAAVKGIDFHLQKGEMIALLGANGAGKSSTLNAIMGLVPCTCDTLSIDGKPMQSRPVEARAAAGVGFSPEGRRVFGGMSVFDNLRAGGYRLSAEKCQIQMDAMMDRFPVLRERADQLAGSLSGGEQQMLAIARALMHEPTFLILDEPSLGLAPRIVADLFVLVDEMHQDGLSVLLVEQNVRRSLAIADRGYILELGRITREGPASEMANDPDVINAYLKKAE